MLLEDARSCGPKNIERWLAAPIARILETGLWIALVIPLSGLVCFLSGDLAPHDLWNSKNIKKAAALSPKVVDYLSFLLSKLFKERIIFTPCPIVSSILYL